MIRADIKQRLLRATLATALVPVAVTGCTVHQQRVSVTPADHAAAEVQARVEAREGRRKPTWKPIVVGVLAAVSVGAVGMVWGGFLAPNRPLAVTGLVLVTTVPTLGSIPYLIKQDVPWTETKWEPWAPASGVTADIALLGAGAPVRSQLVTDADGRIRVSLPTTLCADPGLRSLSLVDVEVRVPKAEPGDTTVSVDRLPPPCSAGSLSLFDRKEPEQHVAQ